MLNLTARIAVKMQNLPPWDVDWADSRPHRHQSSLRARESPHRLQKFVAVPMKVLFRNKKQKAETIEVLSDLVKDAALTGNPQVSNEDDNTI